MTDVDDVLRTVADLLQRANIAFMVVGSYASFAHGEPRTTFDLDLVIDPTPDALDVFLTSIDLDAYYVDVDVAREALRRRAMFNIIDMTSAWKVDLVIRKARPFSETELGRRVVRRIVDVDVPTATAEDTILAKLEWARDGGSERQLADVAGIVRVQGEALDRAYLERWLDELAVRAEWLRALMLV